MFNPHYTPEQMLSLGVFDGTYFANGGAEDIPAEWLSQAARSNKYAPRVSQSREQWSQNGWITADDPLGWFQWYCRYYMGRRIIGVDEWQMRRWQSFGARHGAAVRLNGGGDLCKRVRQRQSLLHWSHDPEPDVTNT